MNKIALPGLVIGAVLMIACLPVHAMDVIASSSHDYYRLGAGSDLNFPPVSNDNSLTLGGDINSDLAGSCAFNPSVSVSNTLNNIKDSVQGMSQSVISSATSAVGSLPMYLLSKSNKDLYNLVENTMSSAEDTFNLHTTSCNEAMDKIKQGKSPYEDWFSVSDSQGWFQASKRAKQGQDVDVNHVAKDLAKDPKKYGVPWVHHGENSGGSIGSQVPIRVIYDVVVAGYNAIVDPHNSLDDKTTQAPKNSGLSKYFKTADKAGKWARLVLGDITISSKDGEDDTHRSVGLMTLIQTCPDGDTNTCIKTIAKNMSKILAKPKPTPEDIDSISSVSMVATPQVLRAVRDMTPVNQSLAVSKWAEDVAIQNVVSKALMLRRILIAGLVAQ